MVETVPSTFHQKIKFIIDGCLICVAAEENIIVATTSTAPYVEVNENAKECSFRSLKFVNATFLGDGQKILVPRLSKTTRSGLNKLLGNEQVIRVALGRKLQGRVRPIAVKQKNDRFGLGYTSTGVKKKRFLKEKKEKRAANFSR